ncbi:hypothetical protein [Streptomyces sp. NPDC058373]|uniref:hypothetical protein n=1 Tax=unclassified Streptomyces TaxID=2593676 RepID=UPI00364F9E1D
MLAPTRGMYRHLPGEVDLVALHLEASGFPVDRDEERCLVSNDWWHGKTLDQQRAWKQETEDLVAAWVAAAQAGIPRLRRRLRHWPPGTSGG